MELVLEIADFAHASQDGQGSKTFGPGGGLIGRSPDCAWVIGAAHGYVSNHHANISFRDGHFYLTDMSSNGIWLRCGQIKLTRGQPHRIEQGDHFRLANLEVRARLTGNELLEEYEAGKQQEALDILPDESLDPVLAIVRAEAASTYGEALSDLFEVRAEEQKLQPGPVERQSLRVPELVMAEDSHPPAAVQPGESFWCRFGRSLGLDLQTIGNSDREALAINVAHQLKVTLEGLERCLRTCDELRSELGLNAGRAGRILGQSDGVKQVLTQLLPHSQPDNEVRAEEAVTNAFRDLQAHQFALIAASRNVARAALEAFAPSHLKLRLEREPDQPWLQTAGNRWRAFERYHQSLMDDEQRRASLFARDFAHTYEEQARLIATLQIDYPG